MYQTLTFYHNSLRWIVLASLILAIYRAYQGYYHKTLFSKTDNLIRHWTATILHVQLMLGMILYFQSPIVTYFWKNTKEAIKQVDLSFFGIIHIFLMLTAVVLITIGSSLAKRKETDRQKFKTMLIWYSIGLLIILIAIPWPFSPLASRPYFR